ncbi:MAG: hypothetical protein HYR60_05845 [Acidobacteria bacterium]|nr:hypothetical protein [Acidobacteriota bacterium]MBI3470421.1 hypothetical protein [Candidatus Solibacter usitatus]
MKSHYLALLCMAVGPLGAQPAGISSEWDIRAALQGLSAQIARLQPVLEQVHPKEWEGASETYLRQWESTRAQASAVQTVVANLGREPEKLSIALDVFFRLQNLETLLGSLAEGVRRYQNPALADLLSGVVAESSSSRQQLRQYVMDLAQLKEQEFQVMDREAQRCRAFLSRQPAPVKKK